MIQQIIPQTWSSDREGTIPF